MSELKVASLFELEKVLQGRSNKLFYSKSEADKAIAEKDTKIIQLKAFIENYNRISREIIDNANHQKYKRCLAMVEYSNSAAISFSNFSEIDRLKYSFSSGAFRMYRRKYAHFDRWRDKWGKLAEKFKEKK